VGIQCLFPSFYSTLDLHINSLSFLRPLYFEGVNGYSIINRKGKHWGNLFKPQGNRGIYLNLRETGESIMTILPNTIQNIGKNSNMQQGDLAA
jgi:hypothetical protein